MEKELKELKECYCGKSPTRDIDSEDSDYTEIHCECGLMMCGSVEDTISKWNTRTEAQKVEEVKELIGKLDYLINGVANQDVADQMDLITAKISDKIGGG